MMDQFSKPGQTGTIAVQPGQAAAAEEKENMITVHTQPDDQGAAPLRALTREAIVAVSDIRTAWVDLPEWGGRLLVRALTAKEADAFTLSMVTKAGDLDAHRAKGKNVKLITWAAINPDGSKFFTEASDIDMLNAKSRVTIERIAKAIFEISGMTSAGEKEAKNV